METQHIIPLYKPLYYNNIIVYIMAMYYYRIKYMSQRKDKA